MTENDRPGTDPDVPPTSGGNRSGPDVQWSGLTIAAAALHVADLVEQDGALQRVTSLRLQGAPPMVSVALTGVPGRRSFPPDAPLRVVRGR